MTIEHANVTARTGVTYNTGSDPTATQVTAFITAAKNAVKGANGGTAVDETDQTEVEIVLDVVERLVHNYKVEQRELGTPNLAFPPAARLLPPIDAILQEKIDKWWNGDTSSGDTFDYDW